MYLFITTLKAAFLAVVFAPSERKLNVATPAWRRLRRRLSVALGVRRIAPRNAVRVAPAIGSSSREWRDSGTPVVRACWINLEDAFSTIGGRDCHWSVERSWWVDALWKTGPRQILAAVNRIV